MHPCEIDPEDHCWWSDSGYEWCRPCREHHRGPECVINEHGEPLIWCGCTWDEVEECPH